MQDLDNAGNERKWGKVRFFHPDFEFVNECGYFDHQRQRVPWNNNNAENAIKRFAYYREDTIGVMKEAGLTDYLVMLSLCHTCRYRGISFLKFLRSRERDIDSSYTRDHPRRRRPVIEVYPKRFVPPHLARLRDKATQESGEPADQVVVDGS